MPQRTPSTLGGFAPLRHPVFLTALLLLALNDHLLKGEDIIPGWLTGKLSDFAGLTVAPIVLSVLFGRAQWRRALAFVLVGGWFVLANTLSPVAQATVDLGSSLGMTWRFWVDPTDLVALSVMPVAWLIATRPRTEQSKRSPLERFALGFGVAACIASPAPGPEQWTTQAYVYNRTGESITVDVRELRADVDCDLVATRGAELLGPGAFGPPSLYTLEAGETMRLDSRTGDCSVVWFGGATVSDQILFWRDREDQTVLRYPEPDDEAAEENGLIIHQTPDVAHATVGLFPHFTSSPEWMVRLSPQPDYDGGAFCATTPGLRFAWSELFTTQPVVEISHLELGVDGCTYIEVGDGFDLWDTMYICVPEEDFPFEVGHQVRVQAYDRRLIMERFEEGALLLPRLEVYRDVPPDRLNAAARLRLVADEQCAGLRDECGAFRVPMVAVQNGDDTRVAVGQAVNFQDGEQNARIRIGRAEQLLVADSDCDDVADQAGIYLSFLALYQMENR